MHCSRCTPCHLCPTASSIKTLFPIGSCCCCCYLSLLALCLPQGSAATAPASAPATSGQPCHSILLFHLELDPLVLQPLHQQLPAGGGGREAAPNRQAGGLQLLALGGGEQCEDHRLSAFLSRQCGIAHDEPPTNYSPNDALTGGLPLHLRRRTPGHPQATPHLLHPGMCRQHHRAAWWWY